nr:PREDICTED: proline-serine-threonine phosphatase-interacting protein 2 isoform X2 [Equus przewalskii]
MKEHSAEGWGGCPLPAPCPGLPLGMGGGPERDLSPAGSLIHVPLNPLSLPSCFVALQFHNLKNSPTATYTLTSSILLFLVTHVSECSDILSTVGYDSIIQHLNNGRKNCKEFEDFLKERASIEEKYGKDLLNLSRKKPCGQSEINTLKRALEVFKQQVDNVAQCHIQLAQTLREEARKMEEFREKQKLQQKKTELIMDAAHKQKSLQFKKTMDAKKNYEQKCRDKDEAEQAVHRSANLVNPKQQEKLFVKLATSKTAVEDSDKAYMLHVNTLDKIREEWQSEHIKACQMYEEVRKSLEMCSIEKDIEYFVNQRKTGQTPPAPIMYENFYSPQKNAAPPGKATGPNVARRGPLPVPKSLPGDPDYSLIGDYSLIYQ